MTSEPTYPKTAAADKPLVFESSPVLAPHISQAEANAGRGAALHYAKTISSTAAIVAGTIGGTVAGLVLINTGAKQRGLKIVSAAVAGGLAGHTISNLPWNSKPGETPPPLESPITLPNLPGIPTPTPTPHPASPEASVAKPEHAGRVEDASLTTERTA